MSHQAVSRLCCLTLLISLSATACKTAPEKPNFNAGYSNVVLDPIDLELAQLEAEKADAIAERDRVAKLYSRGSNADDKFDYKSYASEVEQASDENDTELKSYCKKVPGKEGEPSKGGEPAKDVGYGHDGKLCCGDWLKKIMEHLRFKRDCIEKKIEEIEGKIRDCKAKKCKGNCNNGGEPGKGWEPGMGGEPGKGWEPGKGGDSDTRVPLPPSKGDYPQQNGGNNPGQNIPNQNDPFPKGK